MMESIEKIHFMMNNPENWDFSEAETLYAGVDLGTYKTIVIIIDENGVPRAANMRTAEVVKSGLIVDYIGALDIVRELMEDIRRYCPQPIKQGATSYPPQTESGNIETTSYILQGADLEVLNVLDEPTAANLVMKVKDGATVDVGGGTTGVAVIKDGKVVYTNDEATGGVHLSLVLAGHYKISYEEAEKIKVDRKRNREVLPIIRPVIDKISSIVDSYLGKFNNLEKVCMVGGTCELDGLTEIVSKNLGVVTFQPQVPQVVTPLGIALSCLESNGCGPRA